MRREPVMELVGKQKFDGWSKETTRTKGGGRWSLVGQAEHQGGFSIISSEYRVVLNPE